MRVSTRIIGLAVLAVLATSCSLLDDRTATISAPEDCEDVPLVPCPRQVAGVTLPLVGSSFSLTYASDRVPGRRKATSLAARPLGLGGWFETGALSLGCGDGVPTG